MFTPHSVTLYIVTENDDYSVNVDTTILRGVFLDATNARSVSTVGANNSGGATLFIPFGVRSTGADGREKTYIDYKRYTELEDPADYWTLCPAGDSSVADCYFVKGEVYSALEYAEAKKLYPDVYKVSSIMTRDFGTRDMQHWQVTAD